jgi:hypothetical protein
VLLTARAPPADEACRRYRTINGAVHRHHVCGQCLHHFVPHAARKVCSEDLGNYGSAGLLGATPPCVLLALSYSQAAAAQLIATCSKMAKRFGRWGEAFGDDVVAAAMIDGLVRHAEVVATNGTQSCSWRSRWRRVSRCRACKSTLITAAACAGLS